MHVLCCSSSSRNETHKLSPSKRQLLEARRSQLDASISRLSLHCVHLGTSQQDTSYARDAAPNLRRALHHSARRNLLLSSVSSELISSLLVYTRSAAKLYRGLLPRTTRSRFACSPPVIVCRLEELALLASRVLQLIHSRINGAFRQTITLL